MLQYIVFEESFEAMTDNIFGALKKHIAFTGQRQVVLSSNVAHANTPRFEVSDLSDGDFSRAIKNSHSLGLATTSPGHIRPRKSESPFRATKDKKATEMTPVGNNVVLEDQMLKISNNSTDQQESINLYKKMISMMKLATK